MRIDKIKLLASFILFFNVFLTSVFGQVMSSAELKMKTVLNTASNVIPKDLQTTKTIVVISIHDNEDIRGDWKVVAEEAHFYIKKLNIDAVLYFYIDDLIAGYDVQRSVTEQMIKRDIKNIFMLSKDEINGRDQFIGVLTSFNQKPDFMSNNQASWKSQTSDLEILFRNLARSIENANLTLENLLVIDNPEYYRGSDIILGKRFELLNTDLRIDRIAIPKFMDLPVPGNSESQSASEMIAMINNENRENLSRNGQIEQLMSRYLYKFEIVQYEYDEKMLLTKGFQFVLMRIASSGKNVRKLLGYEISDNVDELITVKKNSQGEAIVKSIPIDAMVNKYYVKHINSGDIYLGEQWDGDDNWLDAMNNHISSIIEKLGKK